MRAERHGSSTAQRRQKSERPKYIDSDGIEVQHISVKPLSLMRWLSKLLCPPGGTILDPFAGSGTTVEAAMLEDFRHRM